MVLPKPTVSSCSKAVEPEVWPSDPTPLLQPNYRPSTLVRVGPPQCSASVLSSSMVSATWTSPLSSERLVPAVPHKSLRQNHATLTPSTDHPVNQIPGGLVLGDTIAPSFDADFPSYDASSVVHFHSSFCPSPAEFYPGFSLDAHYHGSLPQQLGVVWSPLLEADSEGPSFISRGAFSFPTIRSCYLLSWVLLRHTWYRTR